MIFAITNYIIDRMERRFGLRHGGIIPCEEVYEMYEEELMENYKISKPLVSMILFNIHVAILLVFLSQLSQIEHVQNVPSFTTS